MYVFRFQFHDELTVSEAMAQGQLDLCYARVEAEYFVLWQKGVEENSLEGVGEGRSRGHGLFFKV